MRWITLLVMLTVACSTNNQPKPVSIAIHKWYVVDEKVPLPQGEGYADMSGLQIVYSAKNNTNKTIKHLLVVFKITSETDTIYWDNMVRNIPPGDSESGFTRVPSDFIKDYNHISVNTELVKILN